MSLLLLLLPSHMTLVVDTVLLNPAFCRASNPPKSHRTLVRALSQDEDEVAPAQEPYRVNFPLIAKAELVTVLG